MVTYLQNTVQIHTHTRAHAHIYKDMIGRRALLFKEKADRDRELAIKSANKEFAKIIEEWLNEGPDYSCQYSAVIKSSGHLYANQTIYKLILNVEDIFEESIEKYTKMAEDYGVRVVRKNKELQLHDDGAYIVDASRPRNLKAHDGVETIMDQLREANTLIEQYKATIIDDKNQIAKILQYAVFIKNKVSDMMCAATKE